ncbi:class II fumarate hydratase [Natronorubrum sp. FCH18a]|uniref:class II fumarate hydratase n=1 Tax=Natronorubrum sp. FCH18a TaxID=3447018 RepID=UPI003F51071D
MTEDYRIESDSLVGDVKVPEDALYGPQTQVALENFNISELRFDREFIRTLGLVKDAAARANVELDLLDEARGEAIQQAAGEVTDGEHDDEFQLNIFQLGSGTNTNMNANEVIANRAAELLGEERGSRHVHPNDHVNKGQSSNDVIPTTIHVSTRVAVESQLLPELTRLQEELEAKATAFDDIVKTGRTHLQDATPIRLGQEFSGYASQMEHGVERIEGTRDSLEELAIGGTAVGTGLNTHPEFPELVVSHVSDETGITFREAENHFEAQAARDAIVELSGAMKTVAVSLMKVTNDLRWLSSGPRSGLGEISLPTVQPSGSSIMPGKLNPVICEAVNQVAAQVIGNDTAITTAGHAGGNFEINVMKPVMAYNALQSVQLLGSACELLADQIVPGIEAKTNICERNADRSLSLVTALAPAVGYDLAASIAGEALAEDETLEEVTLKRNVLDQEKLDRLLDPRRMTSRGYLADEDRSD